MTATGRGPSACGHWDGAQHRRCGVVPARLYLTGPRCARHTPSALAGVAEPPPGYCAPARCYCGGCPARPADTAPEASAADDAPAADPGRST